MAMNRESGTMLIDGHILSDRDLEVFWTFQKTGKYSVAAKALGISKETVKRIVESPWAKRLFEAKVRAINDSFMHQLQELDADTLEAYGQIIRGERSADKSTMAQAKLIETRMRAGKDPILDTRSTVTNIHNEQKNTVVNLTLEQMKEMTPDELIELNRTGLLPERMRRVEPVPAEGIQFPDTLGPDQLGMKAKLKQVPLALESDAPADS